MIYENLKDIFNLRLSENEFSTNQIKLILNCLDSVMVDYELTSKETSIATINSEDRVLLVNLFLSAKSLTWMSEMTSENFKISLIGKYGLFTLINKTPGEIRPLDIYHYFDLSQKLRLMNGESKASNETLNGYRTRFNTFFSWCVSRHLLQNNPIEMVDKFPEDKKLRDYCDREELEKIRHACLTSRESAIVETMIVTGARISEIASMKIEDIDMIKNEIKIVCGKNHKGRIVSINARAKSALEEYFNSSKPFSGIKFCDINKNMPLFPSTKAPYKKITSNALRNTFEKIVSRTNIVDAKHITPHSMRHSCITILLEDMPIEQVSQYAGHCDISTTQRYNNTPKQLIVDRVKQIAI